MKAAAESPAPEARTDRAIIGLLLAGLGLRLALVMRGGAKFMAGR